MTSKPLLCRSCGRKVKVHKANDGRRGYVSCSFCSIEYCVKREYKLKMYPHTYERLRQFINLQPFKDSRHGATDNGLQWLMLNYDKKKLHHLLEISGALHLMKDGILVLPKQQGRNEDDDQ